METISFSRFEGDYYSIETIDYDSYGDRITVRYDYVFKRREGNKFVYELYNYVTL